VTAPELYFHLRKILEKNKIESSQFEAMCITEHIFGVRLQKLLLDKSPASAEQVVNANNIAYRRSQGEPLQYLLGRWEFYGLEFFVGEGVLIPRQDTETLVDTVISMELKESPQILDLCSGSGCIGITLCKNIKNADVTAVEISEKAVGYINKNIKHNNADMKVLVGDVLNEKTADGFYDIDVIVCNPPYLTAEDMRLLQKEVTYEPEKALFGGEDGLDFYRKITSIWKKTLKDGGILAYEIGIGQENDVIKILEDNSFTNIKTVADLCGVTRVVYGCSTWRITDG